MYVIYQPSLFSGADLAGWPFGALEPFAYQVVMIDPAWRFELFSEKGEAKSAQAHYRTMSIDEICALPVGSLAAPDCLLWLWATAPMLQQALRAMQAWGFAYCTMAVWHKKTRHGKTAFGSGYVMRSACEPVLIGTHGAPKTTNSTRNLFEGLAREHSRKPDEAYRVAEGMMPGVRRADVFSRQTRTGWEACGDESGKFDGGAS